MRTKLYTGHMIPMGGRGGAPIPESSADASRPGLIQMWPIYLDMELAAAKPTLSLPDVAAMLEQQQMPAFNALAAGTTWQCAPSFGPHLCDEVNMPTATEFLPWFDERAQRG